MHNCISGAHIVFCCNVSARSCQYVESRFHHRIENKTALNLGVETKKSPPFTAWKYRFIYVLIYHVYSTVDWFRREKSSVCLTFWPSRRFTLYLKHLRKGECSFFFFFEALVVTVIINLRLRRKFYHWRFSQVSVGQVNSPALLLTLHFFPLRFLD